MKLIVAGKDRSHDIAPEIAQAALATSRLDEPPVFPSDDYSVLSLRAAQTDGEFLDAMIKAMWNRTGISTLDFHVPGRTSVKGRIMTAVRRFLWKLLRYQHDRIAFQQNTINAQMTAAIEFLRTEQKREILELRQEIRRMTAQVDAEPTTRPAAPCDGENP